ncbi:MAG: type IV secretory system conjugative DNA transfer family protein [bacterium]|nr:type IV secretory system conjugative DNA transfer family protein [bacterium]
MRIDKKIIIQNMPYLLFFWIADKLGYMYRITYGNKLIGMIKGIAELFKAPLFSFHPRDMLIGILGALAVKGAVYLKGKNAKKYRKGIEYGSARWGTAADIAPYMDKDFYNNVLLTNTERLTMESRPKQPKYARNKNVLVIGGSGSGKTRFFIKPNLMQMHSSYVVTDPKGTVLIECGKLLQRGGYRIKSLNTINFKKSMKYNPFQYIRSEKDILKLVNTLIANTKGEGEKSGEDFWIKAERLYYCALIGYIWYEAPEEEKNFITLLDMINASEAKEDDENYKSPVDLLFERLEKKEPEHFAVKQYKKYKMAAGKTAKSILISCGARLAPFDIKELRDLMEYDELELDTLGDRKTALFVIISDTDDTFNFVVAIMYTQLFNLLCDKADDVYGGRLPVHVRFLLDEMANIGQIPKFEKLIATIRSREISACIILQAQSQLKAIYKDNADTITGNCDTTLFLGGKEKSTLKEISEALGKETIDTFNTSETRSNQNSYGLNYQKLGKELMSQDELAVMDGGKCILQLRGVRPFLSEKYDITAHPRYKYLADFDERNKFDMERYMKKRKTVVKPDEVFDYYDIELPQTKTETKIKGG